MASPRSYQINAAGSAAGPAILQRGMTLIEILVAIVVLSVGLLGLAGLQLKGLQVNQGSTFRWQAAMLAEDMADRIRADRAGAIAGNYLLPTFGAAPATSASASETAAISEWLLRVAALPSGKAQIIAAPGGTANELKISVQWDDSRGVNGAGGTASGPATTPQTTSFSLTTELWN